MSIPRTFYNANCPVCSAGVAHIRRLTGGGNDLWVDITARPDALASYGADVDTVKKRLHVIDRQGVLRVEGPAFAALWDETPRYHRLARNVRLPMVRQGADALYELLHELAIVLYAWNKRREQRQARACRAAVSARGAE